VVLSDEFWSQVKSDNASEMHCQRADHCNQPNCPMPTSEVCLFGLIFLLVDAVKCIIGDIGAGSRQGNMELVAPCQCELQEVWSKLLLDVIGLVEEDYGDDEEIRVVRKVRRVQG